MLKKHDSKLTESPKPRHQKSMSNSSFKVFDPTPYMDPKLGLSREEIMEIKKAFDIFDDDGSGTISPKELADAFVEFGMSPNNKVIYHILAELDHDNSGVIDFGEFLRLAASRSEFRPTRKELMKVFKIFDIGNKGKISKSDLKKIADELGQEMTEEELKKMLRKADRNDDGFVDFDDFCIITFGKTFEE